MKDDIALVAAALSGDPEMFSPIVERYQDAVFAILYGQDYFEGYARYVPLDCVVRAFLAEKNQIVKQNLIELMRAVLNAQESDESKRR
jgi:hypothetical protein